DLRRDRLDRRQDGEAAVVHVVLLHAGRARGRRQRLARAVLAGEKAARQRRVGDDADLLLATEGLELALVLVAHDEVVLRLDRLVADEAALVARPERAGETPGDVVRRADVTHLALTNEIVKRAQRLVERRVRIVPVRLIEIDVVGLQTAERR